MAEVCMTFSPVSVVPNSTRLPLAKPWVVLGLLLAFWLAAPGGCGYIGPQRRDVCTLAVPPHCHHFRSKRRVTKGMGERGMSQHRFLKATAAGVLAVMSLPTIIIPRRTEAYHGRASGRGSAVGGGRVPARAHSLPEARRHPRGTVRYRAYIDLLELHPKRPLWRPLVRCPA